MHVNTLLVVLQFCYVYFMNLTKYNWLQRITDEDIEALLSDEIFQPKVIWSLGDLQVNMCFKEILQNSFVHCRLCLPINVPTFRQLVEHLAFLQQQ